MGYRKIFGFYLVRAAKYKWYFFLMLLTVIIHGVYPFFYSYSSKLIFDTLQGINLTWTACIKPVFIFCFTIFLMELSYMMSTYAELKAYPHIHEIIMTDFYDILQHKDYSFFQKNQYGAITGKLSDATFVFDYIIEEFLKVLERIFIIAINSVSLMIVCWKMGVLVIVLIGIAFVLSYLLAMKITRSVRVEENSFYQVIGGISDRFINIFSILSFFSLSKEKKLLQHSLQTDFVPKQQRSYNYKYWMVVNMSFFYLGIVLTSFAYAVYLKIEGGISLGDVSLIFGLAIFLANAMIETSISLQSMLYEVGRIKSVFEIIDEGHFMVEGNKTLQITKPTIEFRNVTFKYPDNKNVKNVFDNFNLKIRAGERVGVIGESGVGKSSVISLVLGLFRCNKGEILISDTDIKDVTLKSLRENISIIPQDTILFARSVMENLKYGNKDCKDEEVIEICKQVGLHNAIMNMPQGYDSFVGERGSKLSGGQRQRVSIVRAILKKSPILLLDEATSALDPKTESEIHNLINEIFKDVTMVVVAHRLSTIKNMDRIILLKDGKIFEEGSHHELYNRNSIYRKLWNI